MEGPLHHAMKQGLAELCRRHMDGVLVEADLGVGVGDLVAWIGQSFLLIEIECRQEDRVGRDVLKAAAIGADLLVVMPEASLVKRARSRLALARTANPRVVVTTYGKANQALAQFAAGCRHPVMEGQQPVPTTQIRSNRGASR